MSAIAEELTTTSSDQDPLSGVIGLPSIETPRHSERSSSMDLEGSSTEAGSEYGPTSTIRLDINNMAPSSTSSPTNGPMNGAIPPTSTTKARRTGPPMMPMMMPPSAFEEDQQLPIRPGAEECLFYIHTGWCGYGKACRYNHPPEKMAQHKPKAFNSLGLPLRENAPDCSFFLRVGVCKFGATCKFNHPQTIVDEAVTNGRQPYLAQAAIAMQSGSVMQNAAQGTLTPMAASPQRKHRASNSAGPSSPMAGPLSPNHGAFTVPSSPIGIHPASMYGGQLPPVPPMSPQTLPYATAQPHSQPYIVYYMPQSMERCWSFMSTGRCQMGHQCPYLHS